MNGQYLRRMDTEELTGRLEDRLGTSGLAPIVSVAQDKLQTLADFWPMAGFALERRAIDDKAWSKVMGDGAPDRLARARAALSEVEPFDATGVETALRSVVDELGVKGKEVFQPVRVALTGGTVSPGIFESVALVGREEALARIDAALERARAA